MGITRFAVLLVVAVPMSVGAANHATCSIHITKSATPAELQAYATVTKKDAETIAIANLTTKHGPTLSASLAVEKTCLVWSLEFKRLDKPGLIKVLVDAGNGAFLLERYEKPARQGKLHTQK